MSRLDDVIASGTRAEISRAYADEIIAWQEEKLMHGPPWSEWNRGIGARFGLEGLGQIKREAWRLVDAAT
jgi:hypothetical protein